MLLLIKYYILRLKGEKQAVWLSGWIMGFNNSTNLEIPPQILPFPPKKQPSKLPIDIGDKNEREFYEEYYLHIPVRNEHQM